MQVTQLNGITYVAQWCSLQLSLYNLHISTHLCCICVMPASFPNSVNCAGMHDNNFAASTLLCWVLAALPAWYALRLHSSPCCICSTSLTGWTKSSVPANLLQLPLLLLLQSLDEWPKNAHGPDKRFFYIVFLIKKFMCWLDLYIHSLVHMFVYLFLCLFAWSTHVRP